MRAPSFGRMQKPGHRLISTDWIGQDAWWRRDVGQGSYLTVSRDPNGVWTWRWSEYVEQLREGRTIAQGPGVDSAAEAREAADERVARGLPARPITVASEIRSASLARRSVAEDIVSTVRAFRKQPA